MHATARAPIGALVLALAVCLAVPVSAQPDERERPPRNRLPISVERVKEGLERQPAPRLKLDVQPAVVFRSRVEREYMPTFEEMLRKQFKLNDLQRQSQDWASKGQGLNLIQLAKGIKSAYRDYQARQIEREVTRERLAVEAASRQ